ncbi:MULTISPECIES: DUF6509 family protein [Sutcliffiella]|uniref:Pullulanase n=1 Tax=Sutcliffiella cohnii TaxID=33932 RepID=A0A223KQX6_9BACI|nr:MULTISPECIES: DUF6509 family protein [Sutcliffiella]AST91879.1 pullulanase [Sutcliffiella cohnii]MED4018694.1 DUF6509 family protein [Sutcliffiella cohnii]WBL13106.1 DUF6509 family protein [Sutcliffiella sp. NC1]
MNIIKHEIEEIVDPTGILTGKRYECILHLDVEEEDELYSESGVYVKVLIAMDDNGPRLLSHHLYEEATNKYLDFELEEDELAVILSYCVEHL